MDDQLRIVKPYGRLYTQDREYFLLAPHSIAKDSWMGDNCYQFLVAPTEVVGTDTINGMRCLVCRYARHIITNSFAIELKDDIQEIAIPKSEVGNYDPEEMSILEDEDAEKDEYPY